MRVTECQRKQSVDREDGDGKHLEEQIGSCPTSAPHTGAAGIADLKSDRGPSQVGSGQAEVSEPRHRVIKCWN